MYVYCRRHGITIGCDKCARDAHNAILANPTMPRYTWSIYFPQAGFEDNNGYDDSEFPAIGTRAYLSL